MAITKEEAAMLSAKIYTLVRACPKGRVMTYGWLAAAVGYPRGARMVGWIMSATPAELNVPAHRVINKNGELTGSQAFGARDRMRALLEEDSISFGPDGRVDMKRYGWDPQRDLDPDELEALLESAKTLHVNPPDRLMHLLNDDPASPFKGQPENQDRLA
jgi:methylated-DNA-protein-cysteine methyltransferase-like protein